MRIKKQLLPLTVVTALFGYAVIPGVQAAAFTGPSVALKGGLNFASDGLTSGTSFTLGGEGDYMLPGTSVGLPSRLRVGGDAFLDLNFSTSHTYTANVLGSPATLSYSYGTDVLGADGKVGYVFGRFMPYGKFGLAEVIATGDLGGGSIGIHVGAGIEYELSQAFDATTEWTYDSASGLNNNRLF